uniref:RING-type E3 ubiquitin transferase n=1 Tax=Diabrotica virgifera virgifera TaxID=50390 RepID=A0A6P7G4X1_DIAVI
MEYFPRKEKPIVLICKLRHFDKNYRTMNKENDEDGCPVRIRSITVVELCLDKSFEELRYEEYQINNKIAIIVHNNTARSIFGKPAQPTVGFGNEPNANFSFSTSTSTQASCLFQPNKSVFGNTSTTSGFGQTTDTFGPNPFGSTLGEPPTFGNTFGTGLQPQVAPLFGNNADNPGGFFNNTGTTGLGTFQSNTFPTNTGFNLQPQAAQQSSNSDVSTTSIDLPTETLLRENIITENLSRFLCIQCHKILSRFPVFCTAEGFICGRCPYPKDCIRNDIYELLAQKLQFPCCYKEHGCSENLFPKQVEQHESICRFKKYLCPMNLTPACEWKGFSSELLEHYSECHQECIIRTGVAWLETKPSADINYLLSHEDDLYLFNYSADVGKKILSFTVSYICHDSDKGGSFYKLIFQNTFSKPYYEIQNPINVTTRVKLEDLDQPIRVDELDMNLVKFEIHKGEKMAKKHIMKGEESNSNVNYDILQELECLICCEYMLPPIYQCLTGHSICEGCKESIIECPICRGEFQNTKNFTLAQVIEHMNYPCKFDGCNFVAKSKDIRKHQSTCIYSPTNCPLKEYLDDSEEACVDVVYDHVVKNQDDILEIDCKDKNGTFKNICRSCFIVVYESKIFRLLSRYKNNELCFTAQLIEPSYESSCYFFDIDILDKEKNSGVRKTNSCGLVTDTKTAFDDDMTVITFTYSEIRHLIDNQIFFKIKIIKI